MGNDYYQWNEHLMVREDEWVPSGEILGYYVITKQYYDRYRLPVMHTETNAVTDQAVTWLWKEWSSMIRLRDDRIPIVGFTWYSLTDQIDWDSGLTRRERQRVQSGPVRSRPQAAPGRPRLPASHRSLDKRD